MIIFFLSIHSIKLPGVKKSVIWHECDENSVKTPLGCKKTFTSSCHEDVNGFLHPGGVFLYFIDFTSLFVVPIFNTDSEIAFYKKSLSRNWFCKALVIQLHDSCPSGTRL